MCMMPRLRDGPPTTHARAGFGLRIIISAANKCKHKQKRLMKSLLNISVLAGASGCVSGKQLCVNYDLKRSWRWKCNITAG